MSEQSMRLETTAQHSTAQRKEAHHSAAGLTWTTFSTSIGLSTTHLQSEKDRNEPAGRQQELGDILLLHATHIATRPDEASTVQPSPQPSTLPRSAYSTMAPRMANQAGSTWCTGCSRKPISTTPVT